MVIMATPNQERALDAMRLLAQARHIELCEIDCTQCLRLKGNALLRQSETQIVIALGVAARFVVRNIFRWDPNVSSNASPYGKPPPDQESVAIIWNHQLWWGTYDGVNELIQAFKSAEAEEAEQRALEID